MKKIFDRSLFLLLTLSFLSCKESTTKENRSNGDQKIELMADGIKKTLDPAPLITTAYTNSHFMLSYLSEKDDIQFTISAYMQDLKPGSYQVYDCKSASECDDEKVPDNNQIALYGPYPKNPPPPVNLSRVAYYAPRLGLKPLTLVITSITDEQQLGNPFKTKRIKGQFNGSLAHVERQQGGYDYYVVGKTTPIDGNFEMFCTIHPN
ncbi:hypothetical protein FAM09_16555 [Niastella caeni]|uniref:Lipoprotein n=1 Tax=Niastella caeni TaxID=2569763 RepID=A0A4V4H0X7_9BACT|nr:hypothetical protein [Niastella caeni]THU38286.1 hypothetical protein FAM09_16555 [Niastella caeni]